MGTAVTIFVSLSIGVLVGILVMAAFRAAAEADRAQGEWETDS